MKKRRVWPWVVLVVVVLIIGGGLFAKRKAGQGQALDPTLLDLSDRRAAQKTRFGGELFPNVIETQSGLSFAEFFQNERDSSRKGIVVIHLRPGGAV